MIWVARFPAGLTLGWRFSPGSRPAHVSLLSELSLRDRIGTTFRRVSGHASRDGIAHLHFEPAPRDSDRRPRAR